MCDPLGVGFSVASGEEGVETFEIEGGAEK